MCIQVNIDHDKLKDYMRLNIFKNSYFKKQINLVKNNLRYFISVVLFRKNEMSTFEVEHIYKYIYILFFQLKIFILKKNMENVHQEETYVFFR